LQKILGDRIQSGMTDVIKMIFGKPPKKPEAEPEGPPP